MNRFLRIATRGWLSAAVSVFTLGYYPGEATMTTPNRFVANAAVAIRLRANAPVAIRLQANAPVATRLQANAPAEIVS